MISAQKFIVASLILSTTGFAQSLPEANAALAQAQQHFRACKNGKLQLEFAPVLGKIEGARKALEKGRRQTEAARRSLEATRKRIEAGHQLRHASAQEREAKEQHYAQRLTGDYLEPMKALSPLTARYAAGIEAYAAVMDQYASFCAGPGITTSSARSFIEGLGPAVAALSTDARTYLASASKAAAGDVAVH